VAWLWPPFSAVTEVPVGARRSAVTLVAAMKKVPAQGPHWSEHMCPPRRCRNSRPMAAVCRCGRLGAEELRDAGGHPFGLFEPRPVAGSRDRRHLRVAKDAPLPLNLVSRNVSVVSAQATRRAARGLTAQYRRRTLG
jgi:hypothetical protein